MAILKHEMRQKHWTKETGPLCNQRNEQKYFYVRCCFSRCNQSQQKKLVRNSFYSTTITSDKNDVHGFNGRH